MSEQLGQHALIDSTVIMRMVELAQLEPSDAVLEIGSGAGAITTALLAAPVHHVIAVEADRNYAPRLLAYMKQHPHRLSVVFGDALRTAELETFNKIVSNLPFHISEPLMKLLVQRAIQRGVFIFGENFWNVLSEQTRIGVGIRLCYDIKLEATLPRSVFDPPPRTDAILATVTKREDSSLSQGELVLRETLRQDDKLLKNALEGAIKGVLGVPKKVAHEQSLTLAPVELLDKRIEHLSTVQFGRFVEQFYKDFSVTIGTE